MGQFSYRTLSEGRYPVGVTLETTGQTQFLMASAEKALVDKVWTDARFSGQRVSEYDAYLLDDLRIDQGALLRLDYLRLAVIAKAYDSRKIDKLLRGLKRLGEVR